jgi:hypothetical protein
MFEISLVVNIILGFTVLTLVFAPSLVKIYKKYKTKRETRRTKEIQRIVKEYLNTLRND